MFDGRFSVGGVVSHATTVAVTLNDVWRLNELPFMFVPDAV